ncbi:MAG TPA: putative collagen-binding domain-containing protein, partial [Chloroflexota bacterium]|nr:putative collagen-binding domain-containing protein [Chloroflexota bacterium]
WAFVYSTRGYSFTIDMEKLSGETVRAAWFDPRTGTSETIGEFAAEGEQTFAPPRIGHGYDWVLVLDDVSRGFALP